MRAAIADKSTYTKFLEACSKLSYDEFICVAGALGHKFIIKYAEPIKVALGENPDASAITVYIDGLTAAGYEQVKTTRVGVLCKSAQIVKGSAPRLGVTLESVLSKLSAGESDQPAYAGFLAAVRADDVSAFKTWFNDYSANKRGGSGANTDSAHTQLCKKWQLCAVVLHDALDLYEFMLANDVECNARKYVKLYMHGMGETANATHAGERINEARIYNKLYAGDIKITVTPLGANVSSVKKGDA